MLHQFRFFPVFQFLILQFIKIMKTKVNTRKSLNHSQIKIYFKKLVSAERLFTVCTVMQISATLICINVAISEIHFRKNSSIN